MGAWVSSVSSATSKPVCMTLFVSYKGSCINWIGETERTIEPKNPGQAQLSSSPEYKSYNLPPFFQMLADTREMPSCL